MGAVPRGLTGKDPLSEAIRSTRQSGGVPVIVDIKPISPQEGDLLKGRSAADLAARAEKAGACAVSVVTESGHFGGSIDMLRQVAAACSVPVLQKDFFSTPEQVVQSHRAGAGALLIILATTSDDTALTLYRQARRLAMEAVVEVHTADELQRALKLEPAIIGINNRDIRRLEKDSGDVRVTEQLAPLVPGHILTISESGLRSSLDVQRALRAGADAVLIGTAVLKKEDIRAALEELIAFAAK